MCIRDRGTLAHFLQRGGISGGRPALHLNGDGRFLSGTATPVSYTHLGSVLLIDKKPQCMGVIVSQCLFNGTGFRPSGNIQTDNEKKLHGAFLIQSRFYS